MVARRQSNLRTSAARSQLQPIMVLGPSIRNLSCDLSVARENHVGAQTNGDISKVPVASVTLCHTN